MIYNRMHINQIILAIKQTDHTKEDGQKKVEKKHDKKHNNNDGWHPVQRLLITLSIL